jgi:predicted GNAT family acetyltransferase
VMTVYHTEVSSEAEGKGLGKQLFIAMTDHAKAHQLKVKAICSFVQAQFARNEQAYGDLMIRS